MMKFVGKRPMVNCFLDDKSCNMLWDKGLIISMVDQEWVMENCADKEVTCVQLHGGRPE